MRCVSSVLIPLLGLCMTMRQPCAGGEGKPVSPADAALDEVEKQLDALEKGLGDLLKPKDPKAAEILEPFRKAFALDRMRAETQRMRDAIAKVVVTPEDVDGLRFYCRGDHANARKKFSDSDAKKPNREFPVYFLGTMAFQDEEYARAVELFSTVAARNRECRSAFVLRQLAKLCEGKRRIPDLELALLFDRAARAAAGELGLVGEVEEPTVAELTFPPLASDPVLLKMAECLDAIRVGDLRDLLNGYRKADTVERKLTIALLTGSDMLAHTLVQAVAQEYPDNKDARVFAFFYRHFVRPLEERRKPLDGFADELSAVRQFDSDNGVLMLLGISPGNDELDAKALTQEELAIFRKALKTREFRTYVDFLHDEVGREHVALYGGLSGVVRCARAPWAHGHIYRVAERAAANVVALARQGETDDALALYSDIEALAARVRAETRIAFIMAIFGDTVVQRLYRTVRSYAREARDERLLSKCLDGFAEVCRNEARWHIAAGDFGSTLARMPVRRLAEALAKVNDAPGFAMQLSARRLKADPLRHYTKAARALANVGEGYVMSGTYPHIAVLGDLKSSGAVPLLTKLAGHSDPLLAHMAAKALAGYKERQEPARNIKRQ